MFDAISGLSIVTTNIPAAKSGNGTTETGDAVDGRGFEEIVHIVQLGAEGDTLTGSLLLELILQESDSSGSGYTVVTDANSVNINTNSYDGVVTEPDSSGIFATIDAAAEADKVYAIGYRGKKRYSRVLSAKTGNHSTGTVAAMLALRKRSAVSPV